MDGTNRGEAERWLYTANKLLSARDLHGARSFAIRARESDPRFEATELLLAVIDTLLAGETRIKEHLDYYAVLQVIRYTQNIEYIADQYRRLAILLDPNRNPFAYASHAFSLVHDAWSIFSNPHKKAMYDQQLHFLTQPPPPPQQLQPPPQQQPQFFQPPPPQQQQQPEPQPQPIQPPHPQVQVNLNHNHNHIHNQRKNPRPRPEPEPEPVEQQNNGMSYDNADESTVLRPRPEPAGDRSGETEGGSFWTACPYCFGMFEYPKVYEDCTLRCQNCRRGFHAVVVRAPPEFSEDGGKDVGLFCSFGYFPLGFTGNFKDISGLSNEWNPISPLFACPGNGGSRKNARKGPVSYYDHDTCAAFAELSDETEDDTDDDDWRRGNGTSGRKIDRRRRRRRTFDGGAGEERRPVDRPRRVGQNGNGGNDNVDDGEAVDAASAPAPATVLNVEARKKAMLDGLRRRGAGNMGKLDLNVEFSNEVEEAAAAAAGTKEGNVNATGNAEDNIEGIGFFEGLDEFLDSLPILNVVADDKVKCH